jgi:hypothetical protein
VRNHCFGRDYERLGSEATSQPALLSANLTRLLALSNERFIFEGVHHDHKFCLLSFEKGGETESFEASFKIDVRDAISSDELDSFLNSDNFLSIPVELVHRLAPSSLAIMEFKNAADIGTAEAMFKFPILGAELPGYWDLSLCNEFHMTGDSDLFKTTSTQKRLSLFEGKMIHQFESGWGDPKYWIDEQAGTERLLATRRMQAKQASKRLGIELLKTTIPLLDYNEYRLAFRDVGPSTNERSMIATILPRRVFCPHTMSLERVYSIRGADGVLELNHRAISSTERLYLCAVFNSFVVDGWLRRTVRKHVSFYHVYATPVPRLTEKDPAFAPIVSRAAKLICTTPEFDDLAREVGLGSHAEGVTDPVARATLRAELDGLVAHLYGLTEDEFAYILTTFPLVAQPVKEAALGAFRTFMPKPGDREIAALLAAGESARVEFKSSARWDLREHKKNPLLEQVIIKTVAAFLNSDGGTLLLGVADDGTALGLDADFQTLQKKNADGYELFLTDLLLGHYGKDISPAVRITFHSLDGKQVCRVITQPAPRPIWVKEAAEEHLYIRSGNSTRRLSTREALEYCKTRWKA